MILCICYFYVQVEETLPKKPLIAKMFKYEWTEKRQKGKATMKGKKYIENGTRYIQGTTIKKSAQTLHTILAG